MRRGALVLALLGSLLVLAPTPAWACSCVDRATPELVRDAVTVASGTVEWTASNGQTRTYQVDVDAVYKGDAAESEKLATHANEASCGLADLATDRRYLFFIDGRHPGAMRVGLCGGTTAYDDRLAAEVEAITGPPAAPLARTDATPVDDDGGGNRWWLGGLAALLVALGATAVVLRRRT